MIGDDVPPDREHDHDCAAWRLAVDERLDGAPAALLRPGLDEHLVRCARCRAYEVDLLRIRAELRAMPVAEHDDDDALIRAILARTIDRETRFRGTSRPVLARLDGPRRRAVLSGAAAAAVAMAALGAWLLAPRNFERGNASVGDAQLVQLEQDLDVVMAALAGALSRTEHVAVEDVLQRETAGVLRHLPNGDADPASSHE
jgi:predicted anti-sigma-YlaC factor YlaD